MREFAGCSDRKADAVIESVKFCPFETTSTLWIKPSPPSLFVNVLKNSVPHSEDIFRKSPYNVCNFLTRQKAFQALADQVSEVSLPTLEAQFQKKYPFIHFDKILFFCMLAYVSRQVIYDWKTEHGFNPIGVYRKIRY